MSPHATVCQVCQPPKLIADHERDSHRNLHERQRTEQRKTTEPWRRLYTRPEWARAKRQVLHRDANRCRALENNGERCIARDTLQVDHRQPLRVLWTVYGETMTSQFVHAATDPDNLITLCPSHHAQAERSRR